jgi:hypothetical protein
MNSDNDYSTSGFDKFLSRSSQSLQGPLDQENIQNNAASFDRTQVSGVVGDTFRTTKTSQQGILDGEIVLNGVLTIGNIVIDGVNDNITLRDTTTNRIIFGKLPDGSYGFVISKDNIDVQSAF